VGSQAEQAGDDRGQQHGGQPPQWPGPSTVPVVAIRSSRAQRSLTGIMDRVRYGAQRVGDEDGPDEPAQAAQGVEQDPVGERPGQRRFDLARRGPVVRQRPAHPAGQAVGDPDQQRDQQNRGSQADRHSTGAAQRVKGGAAARRLKWMSGHGGFTGCRVPDR
jgi:hypothetical protein